MNHIYLCRVVILFITSFILVVVCHTQTTLNSYNPNEKATLFHIDTDQLKKQFKSEQLHIDLPFKSEKLNLHLTELQIYSDDFELEIATAKGLRNQKYIPGKYYTGTITQDPNASAIIGIEGSEVKGIINYRYETLELGKVPNSDLHVIHNAAAQIAKNDFICGAINPEDYMAQLKDSETPNPQKSAGCNAPVRLYVECDYNMYQHFNYNLNKTLAHTNAVFAEVKTLYNRVGINIEISKIKVWTISDPYSNTSSALYDFSKNIGASLVGDIGLLLSMDAGSQGGIAYVGGLCGNQPFGYIDLLGSIETYPIYSWDASSVAHEVGHIFGSLHTHDCVWGPNNDRQIDDCGNVLLGNSKCFDSQAPIIPKNGGTIMSYCHLNKTGINLSKGFGPEPSALILRNYEACYCDNKKCELATPISTSGIYDAEPSSGSGGSQNVHADWFSFTPTSDGSINVNSCYGGADTRLWLYEGPCHNLKYISKSDDNCNDKVGSKYASELNNIVVQKGKTYYIEWDGRWSTISFQWEFEFISRNVNIGCIDNDKDGICQNDDCNDYDANIGARQSAGSSCNDNNNSTINDVILSDGCTCRGESVGPCYFNGGDSDGDGLCNDQDNCPNLHYNLVGTACNDDNPCTTGETYNHNCGCSGGIVTDNDNDGYCATQDPNDNDPCNPYVNPAICFTSGNGSGGNGNSGTLDCKENFFSNFENAELDIWNTSGSASRIFQHEYFSFSGNTSVYISDNKGFTSSMYTDVLNLNSVERIELEFNLYPYSQESGDAFIVETGNTQGVYTEIKKYYAGIHYTNFQRTSLSLDINASQFSSNTIIRIRSVGNEASDYIFIDDIKITYCKTDGSSSGCVPYAACDDKDDCTQGEYYNLNCNCVGGTYIDFDNDGYCAAKDADDNNACIPINCSNDCTEKYNDGFESSLGIWRLGGFASFRFQNPSFAPSGSYSVFLNGNNGVASSFFTDIKGYNGDQLKIEFLLGSHSVEAGDGFVLEAKGINGVYRTIQSYRANTDFDITTNNVLSAFISLESGNNIAVRFRMDAGDSSDYLFFDDIVISVCSNSLTVLREKLEGANSNEQLEVNLRSNEENNLEENNLEEVPSILKIYPNPILNDITVETHKQDVNLPGPILKIITVDIYSMTGIKIPALLDFDSPYKCRINIPRSISNQQLVLSVLYEDGSREIHKVTKHSGQF